MPAFCTILESSGCTKRCWSRPKNFILRNSRSFRRASITCARNWNCATSAASFARTSVLPAATPCPPLRLSMRNCAPSLPSSTRPSQPSSQPTSRPCLEEGEFAQLSAIAGRTYRDPNGVERPLLTPEEVRFLSIPQGSLDPCERQQIEAHVVHSFNFLMQIPWTREIRGIPEIARAASRKT